MEDQKSCVLCCKVLTIQDTQVLNNMFKEMLDVLLINLNLDNLDVQATCDICIDKIRNAFSFKRTCIETMDCLVPYIGPDGSLILDLKSIYKKERKGSEKMDKTSEVCRLCMNLLQKGSSTRLLDVLEERHFFENFEKYLPEIAPFATENSLACDSCLIALQHLSDLIFMTSLNSSILPSKITIQEEHTPVAAAADSNKCLLINSNKTKTPKPKTKSKTDTVDVKIEVTQTTEILNQKQNVFKESATKTKVVHSKEDSKTKENVVEKPIVQIEILKSTEGLKQVLENVPNKEPSRSSNCIHPTAIISNPLGTDNTNKIIDIDTVEIIEDTESNHESQIIDDSDDDVEILTDVEEIIEIDDEDFHPRIQTEVMVIERFSHSDASRIVLEKQHTSGSPAKYECDYCLFETNNPKMLLVHLEVHVLKQNGCSLCSFKTKAVIRLEAHMLVWHKDQVKKQQISCKYCKFQSDYYYYFYQHMETHNCKIHYIICSVCTFKTRYQEILTLHIDEAHVSERIEIDVSDVLNPNVDTIVLQKQNVSKGVISLYECDICLFKDQNPLVYYKHEHRHLKNQLSKKIIECNICSFKCRGLVARNNHMLVWHKDTVGKERIDCKHCKFSTDYLHYFQEHMKLHKYNTSYCACSDCEYKSKYRDILTLHLQHKHKASYKCNICSFKSTSKVKINAHINNCFKQQQSLLRCEYCNYKCVSRAVLFRHVKRNHLHGNMSTKKRNIQGVY